MSSSTNPLFGLKRGKGRPKRERSFLVELLEMGVTKPYVAKKMKEVFEDGDAKEKLQASRMYLALTGDIKDEKGGATNVFNAPTMVIVGASQERIKALRGAIPQLTDEQKEDADKQAFAEKFEAFKRGELGFISRHSKAKHEESSIDVESGTPECAREAESSAG